MSSIETRNLAQAAAEVAPDGLQIHRLLPLRGGGRAHCTLHAGETSRAMRHRSVEEIWFVLQGRGQLWRKRGAAKQVVMVEHPACLASCRNKGISRTPRIELDFACGGRGGAPGQPRDRCCAARVRLVRLFARIILMSGLRP